MFALLLGGGVVYLLLGEALDAGVLLIFAKLSVSISIVQETRNERVLEALHNFASPRALVLRDGVRARIPGRDIVPGDVIILSESDRVPADAVLVNGDDPRCLSIAFAEDFCHRLRQCGVRCDFFQRAGEPPAPIRKF